MSFMFRSLFKPSMANGGKTICNLSQSKYILIQMKLSFSKSPQTMSWILGVLNNFYFILMSLFGLLAKIWGNMIRAFCMFFQIVFTTHLWMIFNDFSHLKPPSWQMIIHSVESSQIIWICRTQINSTWEQFFSQKKEYTVLNWENQATLVIRFIILEYLVLLSVFYVLGLYINQHL